jgi:hypothetical protein
MLEVRIAVGDGDQQSFVFSPAAFINAGIMDRLSKLTADKYAPWLKVVQGTPTKKSVDAPTAEAYSEPQLAPQPPAAKKQAAANQFAMNFGAEEGEPKPTPSQTKTSPKMQGEVAPSGLLAALNFNMED